MFKDGASESRYDDSMRMSEYPFHLSFTDCLYSDQFRPSLADRKEDWMRVPNQSEPTSSINRDISPKSKIGNEDGVFTNVPSVHLFLPKILEGRYTERDTVLVVPWTH